MLPNTTPCDDSDRKNVLKYPKININPNAKCGYKEFSDDPKQVHMIIHINMLVPLQRNPKF